MDRRHFVKTAVAAGLFASLPARSQTSSGNSKRQRFACNSWPFRAYFDTPEMHHYRDAKYPLLNQWQFPEFLADTFGIHNVEFLPQHFADTQPSTIEKIKAGLAKAHSRCCNLMGLEPPGDVFARTDNHTAVLHEAERWLAVAVSLDCPTVTVALAGNSRPDAATAASNLAGVVDAAQRHGRKILFHNDDINRESAEILSAVIDRLGRNRTGTCPDFGNFATRSAEYALSQLRILAPYASSMCHAKDGIADGATFYKDDFKASMQIMQDNHFRGLYSMEFEGLGEPVEGVRHLIAMTEEYLR